MLEGLRYRIRGYVPFTNWWLLGRKLDRTAETILDLGCGRGKQMQFLNKSKRFYTTGIDLLPPYLDECQRDGSYDRVYRRDVRDLPYPDKSVDIVICLELLEHLEKEDGEKLIKDMVRIARKQVLVETPIGSYDWEGIHGNPLNKHLYVWSLAELQECGFDVIYGQSLKGMSGDNGWSRHIPFRWLWNTAVTILIGWLVYHKPEWAGAVLCVKEIRDNG